MRLGSSPRWESQLFLIVISNMLVIPRFDSGRGFWGGIKVSEGERGTQRQLAGRKRCERVQRIKTFHLRLKQTLLMLYGFDRSLLKSQFLFGKTVRQLVEVEMNLHTCMSPDEELLCQYLCFQSQQLICLSCSLCFTTTYVLTCVRSTEMLLVRLQFDWPSFSSYSTAAEPLQFIWMFNDHILIQPLWAESHPLKIRIFNQRLFSVLS